MESFFSRIGFSLIANSFRAACGMITAIVLARAMGPETYGIYIFLTVSLMALLPIVDAGTSRAFFTFISEKQESAQFLLIYAFWQCIQFVVPLLIVGVFAPQSLLDFLWMDNRRSLVAIAYAAMFFQSQAWLTFIYIGESLRLTKLVQSFNLGIAVFHLLLIIYLSMAFEPEPALLFSLIVMEYLIAVFLLVWLLPFKTFRFQTSFRFGEMIGSYWTYCAPLILLGVFSSMFHFYDTWLLQKFAGSVQQGYYGIAVRLAAMCFLVSRAIAPQVWKELASFQHQGDFAALGLTFSKICRTVLFVGVGMVACYIPFADVFTPMLFGDAYLAAVIPVCVMLLYAPIGATGEIVNAGFYSTRSTRLHLLLNICWMGVCALLAFFLLAPQDSWIAGRGLGATGLALKMLIMGALYCGFGMWLLGRKFGFRPPILASLKTLGLALGGMAVLGFIARSLAEFGNWPILTVVLSFLVTLLAFLGYIVWRVPEIAGFTGDQRDRLVQLVRSYTSRIKPRGSDA